MQQVLERLTSIEDKVDKAERLGRVAEKAAVSQAKKPEYAMLSMPGDKGQCAYWMLAKAKEGAKGKELTNEYHEDALDGVKNGLIQKCMAFCELIRSRGDDEVEEKWLEVVGEDQSEFCDNITAKKKPCQMDRWGGHTEVALSGWREEELSTQTEFLPACPKLVSANRCLTSPGRKMTGATY